MAYADYIFYTTEYLGTTLTEEEFPQLAARASDFIDYYTGGKAAGALTEKQATAVKKACCAIAESYRVILMARASAGSESGELASESVGSYSRSYRSGTETAAFAEQGLANICGRYLAFTGLLYRGGVCCVHSAHCDSL